MTYEFLIDSYASERLKVLSLWSEFRDQDVPLRPLATDQVAMLRMLGRDLHSNYGALQEFLDAKRRRPPAPRSAATLRAHR